MAIPVMVLGDSGSGKTRSLKNLNPDETIVIQPIRKPLPFRSAEWKSFDKEAKKGSVIVSDQYAAINWCIANAESMGKTTIIIDDAQYIMANESLRRSSEKGFDKFTEMAKGYVDMVMFAANHPSNVMVYFMTHTQTNEFGEVKAKTVGKMIDQQIVLEGLFSIVLRCLAKDGRHFFTTKTNGSDCVKTPEEMFESSEIENDLSLVNKSIKDYYGV